uniref:Uncharacterized protein n=1 Tax=Megaselia scalaris TaxID=36166 RepID=T1GZ09_MEGSC
MEAFLPMMKLFWMQHVVVDALLEGVGSKDESRGSFEVTAPSPSPPRSDKKERLSKRESPEDISAWIFQFLIPSRIFQSVCMAFVVYIKKSTATKLVSGKNRNDTYMYATLQQSWYLEDIGVIHTCMQWARHVQRTEDYVPSKIFSLQTQWISKERKTSNQME